MVDIPKATHATGVYHLKEQPIPIIIDDNELNFPRYEGFMEDDVTLGISTMQCFGKNQDGKINPIGIAITIKLTTPNDVMEFVIIPDDEFITELIACKKLYFGKSRPISIFFQINCQTTQIENVWQQNDK